jgi:hypothetical protein
MGVAGGFFGQWVGGRQYGLAVVVTSNGSVYRGAASNLVRHGSGVLIFPDGTIYRGSFEADRRCGKGMILRSDGLCYDGDWRDDKCHGIGTVRFPAGHSYSGEFVNDMMHGTGTLVRADGSRASAVVESNRFVRLDGLRVQGALGRADNEAPSVLPAK